MSLTHEQLEEMWTSIKYIELQTNKYLLVEPNKTLIKYEIDKVKGMIQEVIGQIESGEYIGNNRR